MTTHEQEIEKSAGIKNWLGGRSYEVRLDTGSDDSRIIIIETSDGCYAAVTNGDPLFGEDAERLLPAAAQKTLSNVMPREALLGMGISEENLDAEIEVTFRDNSTTYIIWGNSSAMLIIPDHGQSGWTQDPETVRDVVTRASNLKR